MLLASSNYNLYSFILYSLIHYSFITGIYIALLQRGLLGGASNPSTTKQNHLKVRKECLRKGSRVSGSTKGGYSKLRAQPLQRHVSVLLYFCTYVLLPLISLVHV